MSNNGGANNMPDLPISSIEIEVIKQARAALPKAMQRLIQLAHSKTPGQSRMAIELLFKYGLADRQQQFDIQGNELGTDAAGGKGAINISLNKFELQLNEVMKHVSPATRVEFAMMLEKMQSEADEANFDIIEGQVIEEPEFERCACGCGESVKPGRRFVHGHHMRRHMTHKRLPPHEIKRLKESGQWDEAKEHYGMDKAKVAKIKKDRIKAKKAAKRAALENGDA